MKINVLYRLDAPSGVMESTEANNKLPENIEETVLAELGKLLKNPEVLAGIQNQVNAIQDITQRQLLQATLNRMGRVEDGIAAIHQSTHNRLSWLQDTISA